MGTVENDPITSESRYARMFGLTVRQLRGRVKAKKLPGKVLSDGTVVIATEDLVAWTKRQHPDDTEAPK